MISPFKLFLIQSRSFLKRIYMIVELSIFNFYFSLIGGDDVFPVLLKILFFIIETMQIIHFAFSNSVFLLIYLCIFIKDKAFMKTGCYGCYKIILWCCNDFTVFFPIKFLLLLHNVRKKFKNLYFIRLVFIFVVGMGLISMIFWINYLIIHKRNGGIYFLIFKAFCESF